MIEIVWTLGFEIDIQGIYERLEHQAAGNGEAFYKDATRTMQALQANPLLGRIIFGNRVRRILVHTRDHGMFYTVEGRGVILHCLLNLRQDPSRIEQRLHQI